MGRIEFTTENKAPTVNYEYPKLKLKKGERARIIVGLESPVMEYVHTLRKPQIVNGVPQTVAVTNPRTNKTTMEYKKDFIGRPICLGDPTVLADKGIDPKNCPACALAQKSTDYTTAPQRRYAMHVFKYGVKGGTADVATPFRGELLVWSFTDKVFNKMVDLKEDFGGDLRKHDLVLGPCTNEDFQQFEITPSLQAEWLKDKERRDYVMATFSENQIPDLTIACGSPKQKSWIEQDVETILEAWAEIKAAEGNGGADTPLDADLSSLLDDDKDAEGWSKSGPDASESPAADDGLDALLNGGDTTSESSDTDSSSDDLDALLNGGGEEEKPKATATRKKAAPKAEEAPELAADEPSEDNFDDLLAGMK